MHSWPRDGFANGKLPFNKAASTHHRHTNIGTLLMGHISRAYSWIARSLEKCTMSSTEGAEKLRPQLVTVRPSDPGVVVRHQLLEGIPAKEILTAAENLNVDLIVMGTHGRSGFSRVLIGSVAEEVMRKAPCPVLMATHLFTLLRQSGCHLSFTESNRPSVSRHVHNSSV